MYKKSITIAFFLACMTTATAQEDDATIDISNDINKNFLVGYAYKYGEDCDVRWWAYDDVTEYLMPIGDCKGISKERIYKDVLKQIKYVKANSNAKDFASFYRNGGRNEIDSSNYRMRQFCIDSHNWTYIFLDAEAQNKPGWRYVEAVGMLGGHLKTERVGFWKSTGQNSAIVDYGHGTEVVDISKAYQC